MTTSETDGQRRPPFPVVLTLFAALALALLLGLGVWQVQRLQWKTALLARVEAARTAPPRPLDQVLRASVGGADLEYVRVEVGCRDLETAGNLKLYTPSAEGPGYRIVTTCRLVGAPYDSVLVDRGFLAEADAPKFSRTCGAPLTVPIVGVLRKGDARNFVTPENHPTQNLWYWRDLPAMARSLGAGRPAPVFLMLETPAPRGLGPTPAPLPKDIPNNHLQYAITWFGLAAALLGVYAASLWRRWRP